MKNKRIDQALELEFKKRIDKNVKLISTEDIRDYISEYQLSSRVSNVTIDNVRRILSSFFTWLEEENYISSSNLYLVFFSFSISFRKLTASLLSSNISLKILSYFTQKSETSFDI